MVYTFNYTLFLPPCIALLCDRLREVEGRPEHLREGDLVVRGVAEARLEVVVEAREEVVDLLPVRRLARLGLRVLALRLRHAVRDLLPQEARAVFLARRLRRVISREPEGQYLLG